MSKSVKAFVYNFFGFGVLYFVFYFGIVTFFPMIIGLWIPALSAVASSILAPKFQVVKGQQGDKLFMKMLFIKGVREVN